MKTNIYIKTGKLIEQLRKEAKLTLQEVADRIGVSKSAVCQWEAGSGIKTEMLYEISKFFHVSVTELLSGELKSSQNIDIWKKNYDLSNYDFNDDISEANLEKLKELYFHCKIVQSQFFHMLPRWASNCLSDFEMERFHLLKSYFKFDYTYYRFTNSSSKSWFLEEDEKSFIKKLILEYSSVSIEYDWEIRKLYNFSFDIKKEKVLKSKSLKALKYLLDILPPVEKDDLLMQTLFQEFDEDNENSDRTVGLRVLKLEKKKELSSKEIEENPYLKVMLHAGCNYIFQRDWLNEIIIDEEELDYLIGKRMEMPTNNRPQIFDNERFIVKHWKLCSFDEYQSMIDVSMTDYLKALVDYREVDPLKYYEALKKKDKLTNIVIRQ